MKNEKSNLENKNNLMRESKPIKEASNEFSLEKVCQSSNLLKNLLDVIESHSSEPAVNFGRSIIYFILDDYDKSLNSLEFLVEQYSNVPLLHHRIAEILINRNSYEKASFHLEKVLELDKENLTAKVWLCLTYFKTGDIEKAYDLLNDLNEFIFVLKVGEVKFTALDS